ncbi:MAG: prepilin-type N-terminal cleavage/methylation domain-containing protein [Planctomycetota bacterium]
MRELRVVSFESRVGSDEPLRRRCATSLLAPRALHLAPHLGVTLIELLITITIVSILSAAFLGTSNLAMESARAARTKTTIGKIHGLLMEKWSEYATRRVDVNPEVIQAVDQNVVSNFGNSGNGKRIRGIAMADLRLLALRELMKLEMPDRWSDITGNDISNSLPDQNNSSNDNDFLDPSVLATRPSLSNTYLRRYRSLPTTDEEKLLTNQGAECLYLITMLSTADGEARTLFSEQDIGDTDEDGAKEFLDGWGRPIEFVRWPAGFWERSDLMAGPLFANDDHDPQDMFRRDQIGNTVPGVSVFPNSGNPSVRGHMNDLRTRNNNANVYELPDGTMSPVSAFRLVPLIYSTGSDGIGDIETSPRFVTRLDPYVLDTIDKDFLIGTPDDVNQDDDDNYLDNVHNQLQDNR